ncbi:MAG: PTS galactitol transporter subunit IIBC [Anaerolineae bacterium]|jgi:mannose/fructose/sorbose-specific phosphotransferase system IIA component|nr:PTS galactitol transporter subunit IIBC [Anaerolineae bacterium]MDH7472618.1 PTS galactitol transporter subunit IIBC [Anaerolineae bacterium]
MTQIVLVTHGKLGDELLRTAEMIVGRQDKLHSLSLLAGERPDSLQDRLDGMLQSFGYEDVLILVDMPGGTPYNVAIRWAKAPHVECVTGVNLSMLVETLVGRSKVTARELAGIAVQAGRESVKNAGSFLKQQVAESSRTVQGEGEYSRIGSGAD